MKKKIAIILSIIFIFMNITTVIPEGGSKTGNAVYSDITAYINGYPINSYAIDGRMVILARELENYGFDVLWNETKKTAQISKNESKQIIPQTGIYANARRAGNPAGVYTQTKIVSVMDGKVVPCYSIGGKMAVFFEDLTSFGTVKWDVGNKTINLEVEGMQSIDIVKPEENPNVITMYASDGSTMVVGNEDIAAYKEQGWHDNAEEVKQTLYSADGRTIRVFMYEVPTYLKLNWYLHNPNEKMVALTFDDGPSKYTSAILDQLEKYGAKATFFVVGNRTASYADILRRESNLGMEIGNHSWDHPKLTKLSRQQIEQQKNKTDESVRNITGHTTTVMRPPYGSKNDTVTSVFNQPVVLWSIDTLDWKTRNAQNTVTTVMNNVKDGDIILMHDIYEASAAAAVELIPKLIDAGYQLVTISEMGNARGGLQNGAVYHKINK